MIDIHNHLLPGVDDGSSNLIQSVQQLKLLAENGVEKVYLTPHFMRNIYSNSHRKTVNVRTELKKAVQEAAINVDLESGAEFFLDEQGVETAQKDGLTLGNSNYILVETMMQKIPVNFMDNIYKLQKNGYKIILAHPERYADVINNPEIVEELIHHDIYLQMNAGSFIGFYGRNIERTAYRLLEEGNVHFIASDNHGNQRDCFQRVVYDLIKENISGSIAELLLQENPAAIASGSKIKIHNHWRLPRKPKSMWQNMKAFFTGHE